MVGLVAVMEFVEWQYDRSTYSLVNQSFWQLVGIDAQNDGVARAYGDVATRCCYVVRCGLPCVHCGSMDPLGHWWPLDHIDEDHDDGNGFGHAPYGDDSPRSESLVDQPLAQQAES